MAQELEINGISPIDGQAAGYVPQKPHPQAVKETAPTPEKTAGGDDEIMKMLALVVQKQDSQRVVLDYDKASNQSIVKVIDKASGEVIRQFPPEEIVRMAEMMDQTSLLLDKKM